MTAVLTIRVDDELAEAAKDRARQEGVSLNQYATELFRAALDPNSAGGLVETLRERLRRAGMTILEPAGTSGRPDAALVEAAMAAAGEGTPLAEYVAAGRG